MKLKRPNPKLEAFIKAEIKKMSCPIHRKSAEIKMESEDLPVEVNACCPFFKNDVTITAERIRKEFIYKDEKTRERQERERVKAKYGNNREK